MKKKPDPLNFNGNRGISVHFLPVLIILILFSSALICGCNDTRQDVVQLTPVATETAVITAAVTATEEAVSDQPYVEIKSATLYNSINGKEPQAKHMGYDQILVLDVGIVNPEGSGHEFWVNSETITPTYGASTGYAYDCIHGNPYDIDNPLDGRIHEGETMSGELLYEVHNGFELQYLSLHPDDVDLGHFEIPEIVYQQDEVPVVSNEPYIEITSATLCDSVNGNESEGKEAGYDQILVLGVVVVNPEKSVHEFPVNSKTIIPTYGDYDSDCIYGAVYSLDNILAGRIYKGRTMSGILVYDVHDGLELKYLWLNPGGVDLGHFEIPEIVYRSEY